MNPDYVFVPGIAPTKTTKYFVEIYSDYLSHYRPFGKVFDTLEEAAEIATEIRDFFGVSTRVKIVEQTETIRYLP